MRTAILSLLLFCTPAAATLITSASASIIGPPGFTCDESRAGTTQAHAECNTGGFGIRTYASASFLNLDVRAEAFAGNFPQAWSGRAQGSASYSEMVIINGGSGEGALTITYHQSWQAKNDCNTFSLLAFPSTRTFTYGVPFQLSDSVSAYASSNNHQMEPGFIDCQKVVVNPWDIRDQNGSIVALQIVGADTETVHNPEPSTWVMMLAGLAVIGLKALRFKNAKT